MRGFDALRLRWAGRSLAVRVFWNPWLLPVRVQLRLRGRAAVLMVPPRARRTGLRCDRIAPRDRRETPHLRAPSAPAAAPVPRPHPRGVRAHPHPRSSLLAAQLPGDLRRWMGGYIQGSVAVAPTGTGSRPSCSCRSVSLAPTAYSGRSRRFNCCGSLGGGRPPTRISASCLRLGTGRLRPRRTAGRLAARGRGERAGRGSVVEVSRGAGGPTRSSTVFVMRSVTASSGIRLATGSCPGRWPARWRRRGSYLVRTVCPTG